MNVIEQIEQRIADLNRQGSEVALKERDSLRIKLRQYRKNLQRIPAAEHVLSAGSCNGIGLTREARALAELMLREARRFVRITEKEFAS